MHSYTCRGQASDSMLRNIRSYLVFRKIRRLLNASPTWSCVAGDRIRRNWGM